MNGEKCQTVLIFSEFNQAPVKVPLMDDKDWGDICRKIIRVTDGYSWMDEGIIRMDLRPEVEKLVINGVRVR